MTREIGFSDGGVVPNLDVAWIHGSEAAKYNNDPDIQVHACDEHTYILRQNMAVSYEAPFMFLLFGASRCLLLDTGATANPRYFPLRETAAWPYFGFADEPESVAEVDLGGRVLDCIATPGHHEAAVTYYDRYSRILLTGDTVYPGRLYVFDWPGFVRSIGRLVDWCAQRPVSYRDDHHAGRRLPGRVELPARRNAPGAHHEPPCAAPGHAPSPRLHTRSLRAAGDDHYPGRLNGS